MHPVTGRKADVLKAVVQEYIHTAGPVSSQAVVNGFVQSVSSATIRNDMMYLEHEGLLSQPHTSAGRVPTEKGFRYYVDSLLEEKDLSEEEKHRIASWVTHGGKESPEVMKETCKALAVVSHCAGVVLAPKLSASCLARMEFVSLKSGDVLVIFVTETGSVYHRVVGPEEPNRLPMSQRDLDRMSGYVNGIIIGLSLPEIKERIRQEMGKERVTYNALLRRALSLSKKALKEVGRDEVYIDGQIQVIEQPEFTDVEKMKTLLRALEDKKILLSLLDTAGTGAGEPMSDPPGAAGEDLRIFFGTKTGFFAIEGMTLVTAPYGSTRNIRGTIGVLGPIRMDYSRVIPLVRFTSRLLSAFFAPLTLPER